MVQKGRLTPICAAILAAAVASVTAAGASDGLKSISFQSIKWSEGHATATNRDGESRALGLDQDLQRTVDAALQNSLAMAGAAVLVDARNGQVLAASEFGHTKQGSLLFDPIAPAASVFKIVTTVALYEHTEVAPTTRVCTRGGKRDILQEHLSTPHGADVVCGKFAYALGVSRNAAYAQLATQKLLRADLEATIDTLGLNSPLELDAEGKMAEVELPYNDLAFARTAAGFENSQISVFGAAQLALSIASDGVIKPMHFQETEMALTERRVMSTRTARRLKSAMEVTIHSGTARESFVNEYGRSTVGPVQVAGKTGTLKPEAGAPTASWFIGFAPSDSPRVVVSVLLQNPDKWHRKGHQVGRDLLLAYLKGIGVKAPRR